MLLTLIITFSLLGSLASIAVAALFLVFPEKIRRIILPGAVSYATGALLGAAFLGLIPHAVESLPAAVISKTVLIGIVGFFILEKLVLWRHCHKVDCDVHATAGPLILFGDAFHNFVDGIVIAAAFMVDISLGIMTAISVISHEIPQEVGDFAILLDSNYSRKKAFGLNLISGMTSLVGALLAYFFMSQVQAVVPYVMALSAASFIYIAIGDLIPGLNEHNKLKDSIIQIALMMVGIFTIALFHMNHSH